MKRIFLMLALALVSMVGWAQSPVGKFSIIPKVGMTWAKVTNFDWAATVTEGTDYYKESLKGAKLKGGVTAGADVEYQVSDEWAASAGLFYSLQGMYVPDYIADNQNGTLTGVEDMHADLHYLNVPVMVSRYLFPGFAVKAGVQAGFLLANRMKSETTTFEKQADGTLKATANDDVSDEWDNYQTVDVSIPVGISYEYERVIVDVRYNFGLTKVFDDNLFHSRISVFHFTVGYRL